jgi:hypothetical protein
MTGRAVQVNEKKIDEVGPKNEWNWNKKEKRIK